MTRQTHNRIVVPRSQPRRFYGHGIAGVDLGASGPQGDEDQRREGQTEAAIEDPDCRHPDEGGTPQNVGGDRPGMQVHGGNTI